MIGEAGLEDVPVLAESPERSVDVTNRVRPEFDGQEESDGQVVLVPIGGVGGGKGSNWYTRWIRMSDGDEHAIAVGQAADIFTSFCQHTVIPVLPVLGGIGEC